MDAKINNAESIIEQWIESSEQNYATMKKLVEISENSWALFMGHLMLEKLMKALYVKKLQIHAPLTHDLLRLADSIKINLTIEQKEWLDQITTFNLNTRYENYKQNFHKLCTPDFVKIWILRIDTLREWLTSQL